MRMLALLIICSIHVEVPFLFLLVHLIFIEGCSIEVTQSLIEGLKLLEVLIYVVAWGGRPPYSQDNKQPIYMGR